MWALALWQGCPGLRLNMHVRAVPMLRCSWRALCSCTANEDNLCCCTLSAPGPLPPGVLRLRADDALELCDGQGQLVQCLVVEAGRQGDVVRRGVSLATCSCDCVPTWQLSNRLLT
jgi:hypothetical protein